MVNGGQAGSGVIFVIPILFVHFDLCGEKDSWREDKLKVEPNSCDGLDFSIITLSVSKQVS